MCLLLVQIPITSTHMPNLDYLDQKEIHLVLFWVLDEDFVLKPNGHFYIELLCWVKIKDLELRKNLYETLKFSN